MKTFIAVIALASAATAIPVIDARQAPTAASSASVAATSTSAPTTASPITIQPITSVFNGVSSSLTYNTNTGLVSRTPGVNGDTSTLFTFSIPSAYSSQSCQITFSTVGSDAQVSGTGKAQVFTSRRAAAPGDTNNLRNNYIGDLQAVQGNLGTFTNLFSAGSGQVITVPCSTLISQPNLELAPVGDRDYITWSKSSGNGLLVSITPK